MFARLTQRDADAHRTQCVSVLYTRVRDFWYSFFESNSDGDSRAAILSYNTVALETATAVRAPIDF